MRYYNYMIQFMYSLPNENLAAYIMIVSDVMNYLI